MVSSTAIRARINNEVSWNQVVLQQGQLGKGQRQQMMELIDQPRPLANDRLQPTSDLAEGAQL